MYLHLSRSVYSDGILSGVKRAPNYLQMTKAAASKRVTRLGLASYPGLPLQLFFSFVAAKKAARAGLGYEARLGLSSFFILPRREEFY